MIYLFNALLSTMFFRVYKHSGLIYKNLKSNLFLNLFLNIIYIISHNLIEFINIYFELTETLIYYITKILIENILICRIYGRKY